MTWQGKRRAQLPKDWAQRRQARLELDGFRCTAHVDYTPTQRRMMGDLITQRAVGDRCMARAADVHHAVDAHDHQIESLRSLCAEHHKLETQREAQQAQGRGISRLRPKAQHPGLR